MLVTDGRGRPPEALAAIAAGLAAAGISLSVQLREKQLEAGALLAAARRLRQDLAASGVPLLVNGRLDVALAAGADGVHLPAGGPPLARVREAVGSRLRIGVSTHGPDEVAQAAAAGADYVVFGPVHDTPSKRAMGGPLGLQELRAAAAAAGGVPVLAIGGIGPAEIPGCLEAGAHGVAMMRALLQPGGLPDWIDALPVALRRAGGE